MLSSFRLFVSLFSSVRPEKLRWGSGQLRYLYMFLFKLQLRGKNSLFWDHQLLRFCTKLDWFNISSCFDNPLFRFIYLGFLLFIFTALTVFLNFQGF